MARPWNSKKRAEPQKDLQRENWQYQPLGTADTRIPAIQTTGINNSIKEKPINNNKTINMYTWKFGTINIRTGNEKDEGYKLYSIAKEVENARLQFCCLQEVIHRGLGNKEITLSTGETFVFYWCGQKKRRNAGVGVLIRKSKDIQFDEPDICDPHIMAMNIQMKGFRIRLVNVYSHTNCDGSDNQKETFYRSLKKACIKQHKHQKILICGDFNATTAVSLKQNLLLMGNKLLRTPSAMIMV